MSKSLSKNEEAIEFSQSPNAPLTDKIEQNSKGTKIKHFLFILIPILIIISLIVFILISTHKKEEEKKSFLLDLTDIRKDLIDELISNLPARDKTSLSDMCTSMKKTKEKNSLSDFETAWLIFKWMSENIAYDCYGLKHGSVDTTIEGTYTKGKSVCAGFSLLFKKIATELGIEAVYIEGYEKSACNKGAISSKAKHAWNAIKIGSKYYLIDVTFGTGLCSGEIFSKEFVPFYFCTPPEQFIHSHYPTDSQWQLLDNPIDLNTWTVYADLYAYFYTEGFTSIVPDNSLIKSSNEVVITFYYDPSISSLSISPSFYYADYTKGSLVSEPKTNMEIKNKAGSVELRLILDKKGDYQVRLNSKKTVTVVKENGGSSTSMHFKYIGTLNIQSN